MAASISSSVKVRSAARMPANHNQWAAQYPIPGDFGELGKWHAYAVVRCDLKAETGAVCDVGLYDGPGRAG